jgi:hypothetical protein
LSVARLKRLARFDSQLLRPVADIIDPKLAAAALLAELEWHEANRRAVRSRRACPVVLEREPVEDTPAKAAVRAMLDNIAERLAEPERKRKAKAKASDRHRCRDYRLAPRRRSSPGIAPAYRPIRAQAPGANRAHETDTQCCRRAR